MSDKDVIDRLRAAVHEDTRTVEMLLAEIDLLNAREGRLREALRSIVVNLDGEAADGNIFPRAALRIAREALTDE